MTRKDQHTDLKSLRTIVGWSAGWCDLAQKALNYHLIFGSVSQRPRQKPGKLLFLNEFLLGPLFQMSQILINSHHDRHQYPK